MAIKGKGSLLLLLVSSLVLCRNVASHPTCLEGSKCHGNLQEMYDKATTLSTLMYTRSFLLMWDFKKQFYQSQSPFVFMPAMTVCHTFIIPTPAGKKEAKLMQDTSIINTVIRLLHSWDDPLTYLAQEARHLPKFNHSLTVQAEIIADENQQLQEITSQIAHQFNPEITENVDYALWPGLQILKPAEEQSRLFNIYNTLRCLFNDAKRINFLLQFLKCQESTGNRCQSHILSFYV